MTPIRAGLCSIVLALSMPFLPIVSSFDLGSDLILTPAELRVDRRDPGIPEVGPHLRRDLPADQAPANTHNHEKRYGSGGMYWFSQIKRQGSVAYGNSSHVIWRNVKDFGATGDGSTDDTYAMGNATFAGDVCIYPDCDSTTIMPIIVYVPAGTYMISRPVIMPYQTQMVGDANDLPVLKATSDFFGIGILDSDPYLPYGYSWYQNQNNMWRGVRNFVFDTTNVPPTTAMHGLHWQVAQATSLQNCVFNMPVGTTGDGNQHFGVFMDNGSGGMLEDLIFNGGGIGFFTGNQQFTCRNMTFNNCETGIFQNWDWVFLYKEIYFNNVGIGIDLSQGGDVPAQGSVVLLDAVFTDCEYGVLTSFSGNSTPSSAGTFIMDNVNFVNTDPAISYPNGTVILLGGANVLVESWAQGSAYTAYQDDYYENGLHCYGAAAKYTRIQQTVNGPPKSASLIDTRDSRGFIWSRSKPQWEGVDVSNFISIIDFGCANDGLTDVTICLQAFLDSIEDGQIAYIDHGAYLIRDTITIPNNINIQGEIWPMIMIDGTSPVWQDQFNPVPAIRVGQPGDVGTALLVELIFETRGPAPGAIMMEWNLAGVTPIDTGMWEVYWRMGGTAGTLQQSDMCTKKPNVAHGANSTCIASFLLLHLTSSASLVMSNNWGWVADHEMDLSDHNQIDIYNGRGMLVESQGPVVIYGSAFEHSMLYNYQVANAKDLWMGVIQSETAYMQNNPNALSAFTPQPLTWFDPTFSECSPTVSICPKTFGLRIYNSTYIFIYGTGLYSFFNNYDSGCLLTVNCQQLMVSLEQSEAIYIYALNTVAANVMVEVDGTQLVPAAANYNSFAETVAIFEFP